MILKRHSAFYDPGREIFSSGPFRKLFKNTGLLVGGDTVSAVLGVLTFAVTARALGTEALGMLVLIDAYVRIVNKLVNFQSWQFMIKYGSDALEKKRPAVLKHSLNSKRLWMVPRRSRAARRPSL